VQRTEGLPASQRAQATPMPVAAPLLVWFHLWF
jgi:hypothetical protein